VAINYHRKNGVGHFFSPLHTFVDTSFLGTVPIADIRSGVGEIMKAALIHDVRLYDLMDEHGERMINERFMASPEAARVIKLSIDAMLECIGPDLWEEALLRPMDFGHSFSRNTARPPARPLPRASVAGASGTAIPGDRWYRPHAMRARDRRVLCVWRAQARSRPTSASTCAMGRRSPSTAS
jgi:hypothetical protein